MRSNRQILVVGFAAAIVVVVGLSLWWRLSQDHLVAPQAGERTRTTHASTAAPTSTNALREVGPRHDLDSAVAALKASEGPDASRKRLTKLRNALASSTPEVASRVIREFLDSKADAPTQLGFAVAPDGFLKESPSLRLFLLDYLAQIDPSAAAAYAEKILSSSDSPDEWAVSLRNYALVRTNTEAQALLRQKFGELIRNEAWRNAPSIGFLEAFDVAVHLGGTDLLPDLSSLVKQTENKAVAHAAYLALDRLTLADAAAVLDELNRSPDLLAGREATRANYFARADVSDVQQKAILEKYLLDPNLSRVELQAFTGLYPNANYMVSYNLLTRTITPDRNPLLARDQAALQTVQAWLADPRFAGLRPQLEEIQSRLKGFVGPSDHPPK